MGKGEMILQAGDPEDRRQSDKNEDNNYFL